MCKCCLLQFLFGALRVKKCIRMRKIVLKIVIWGGKSSNICTNIAFYGSAGMSLSNEISDYKTDDLPPQLTILSKVIP